MSAPLTGFLNLYKLSGPTSHDCIRTLKRIFADASHPVLKLGHLGTLDPLARGVLPIAIGSARRLVEYFDCEKVYIAKIRLGTSTDTDDIEGAISNQTDVSALELATVDASLKRFVGVLDQVPPSFSAVKADGERAYNRARKGEDISLKPRKVTVHHSELIGWEPPFLTARFTVGKGTYIRSLARDIGEMLKVGGCIEELKREADGMFLEADSVSVDLLRESGIDGIIERMHPPDFVLDGWPVVNLTREEVLPFEQGKIIERPDILLQEDELLSAYDEIGFIGIATKCEGDGIKAKKVICRRSD